MSITRMASLQGVASYIYLYVFTSVWKAEHLLEVCFVMIVGNA